MKTQVKRLFKVGKSVVGEYTIDGKFYGYTIENFDKLLPCGTFRIEWRKDITPKTEQYQAKYNWFRLHLNIINESLGIFRERGFYHHIANWARELDGCIGHGDSITMDVIGENVVPMVANSRKTFQKVYTKIDSALERGESITLEIIDQTRFNN